MPLDIVDRLHRQRPVYELRIKLPPCGRGLGACEAKIEFTSAGVRLHCVVCDCIAPLKSISVQQEFVEP
jgi:hypothetical protein